MRPMRWDHRIRGTLAWCLIALVESLHGTLRVLWLAPQVGDLAARQIGVVTGSGLILGVAWLTIRWIGAPDRRALWALGALWVALMLAFELGLGRMLGVPWAQLWADYDVRQGGLMGLGLLVLLVAPLVAARLRGEPP
jgi:hypothetical protein